MYILVLILFQVTKFYSYILNKIIEYSKVELKYMSIKNILVDIFTK